MNVEQLKDRLLTLLSEDLGTYTLIGVTTPTPAISIRAVGDTLPTDRTFQGLEVIILKYPPNRKAEPVYGGIRRVVTWQIFMVQHSSGDQTLESAVRKVEAAFPNVVVVSTDIDRQRNIREQVAVRIPDFSEYQESPE